METAYRLRAVCFYMAIEAEINFQYCATLRRQIYQLLEWIYCSRWLQMKITTVDVKGLGLLLAMVANKNRNC